MQRAYAYQPFNWVLNYECLITCYSVHNNDIVSPDMWRLIFIIYIYVSQTTCVWGFTRIITTFALDMNTHGEIYKVRKWAGFLNPTIAKYPKLFAFDQFWSRVLGHWFFAKKWNLAFHLSHSIANKISVYRFLSIQPSPSFFWRILLKRCH